MKTKVGYVSKQGKPIVPVVRIIKNNRSMLKLDTHNSVKSR